MPYSLELPFPPSVNGLFGGGSKQQRFPSKKYKAWLKSLPLAFEPVKFNFPVKIVYRYYWPDNRVRDGQNYMKAVSDYLVNVGIIPDDNWNIVKSETWDHEGVDKHNPRVKVTIYD